MFGKMKKASVLLTLCAMLMLVFGAVLVNWRNWSVDAATNSADSLSKVTFSAVDGTAGSAGTEGYAKAVDGRKSSSNFTKWCTAISGNPYIVIKATERIVLSGYDFTTGNDNADSTKGAGRNPKNWTLSACSDYNETSKTGTWQTIDTKSNNSTMQDINFKTYHFDLSTENKKAYQFYKFQFTATQSDKMLQLCEIELTHDTSKIVPLDGTVGSGSQTYHNLFDGKKTAADFSKWCMTFSSGTFVVFRTPKPTLLSNYTFVSGDDNATTAATNRDPKCWKLYGSYDYNESTKAGSWTEIHSVTTGTPEYNKNYASYNFTIENNTNLYRYYKFVFTENRGGSMMQLGEIELGSSSCAHSFSYPTSVPCATTPRDVYTCSLCGGKYRVATGGASSAHIHGGNGDCSVCGQSVLHSIGNFSIYDGTEGEHYTYEDGVLTVISSRKIIIANTNKNAATSDRIFVQKDVSANIVLAGVNIAAGSGAALGIADDSTGDVVITLKDGSENFLTGASGCAGLQKNGLSGTLTIKGEGKLTAIGGHGGAGIGGKKDNIEPQVANITIESGIVVAVGGSNAAGIGTGNGGDKNDEARHGTSTNIKITGGIVVASVSNGNWASGIGCGYQYVGANCSNLIVSGGSVKSTGGSEAWAFGGSHYFVLSSLKVGSVQPKNESGQTVYLLQIANPNDEDVYIDDVKYAISSHKVLGDTNLYPYLTGEDHTIKVGDVEKKYHFSDGSFVLCEKSTNMAHNDSGHWYACTTSSCTEQYDFVAHTFDQEVKSTEFLKTEETCTTSAQYFKSCICGQKGSEFFNGDAPSGHDYGIWIVEVHATCTATGTKGHKTCSVCNKHFDNTGNEITDLTISKIAHNCGTWIAEVPATCSATGTKGHKTCSACNKNFDNEGVEITNLTISIDTDAHAFGDWVNEDPATCTKTGAKAHKTCSICNKHFDKAGVEITDLTISKIAHICGTWIAEVPATCSATGTKGHKSCSVCNKNFDNLGSEITDLTLSIDTDSHAFGDWVNEDPATCTETGTKGHKDCSRCNKHFDNTGVEITNLTIPATGHTCGTWIAEIPATCSATGTKGHKSCSVCNKNLDNEDNEITNLTLAIDADAHSFGDWVNEDPATCTETGTKGHKDCSRCNKHFDNAGVEITNLTILATGHNCGTWIAEIPATCSETGTKGHKTCENCDKHFDNSDVEIANLTLSIDEDAHSFGEWVNEEPATCIETGTKGHKTCSLCNKHFDNAGVEITSLTLAIDEDAHSFGDWEKDEFCHLHYCPDCETVEDMGAHVYDNNQDLECNTCGYVRGEPITEVKLFLTGYRFGNEVNYGHDLYSYTDKLDGYMEIYFSTDARMIEFGENFDDYIIKSFSAFFEDKEYYCYTILEPRYNDETNEYEYDISSLLAENIKILVNGTTVTAQNIAFRKWGGDPCAFVGFKLPKLEVEEFNKVDADLNFKLTGYEFGNKAEDISVELLSEVTGINFSSEAAYGDNFFITTAKYPDEMFSKMIDGKTALEKNKDYYLGVVFNSQRDYFFDRIYNNEFTLQGCGYHYSLDYSNNECMIIFRLHPLGATKINNLNFTYSGYEVDQKITDITVDYTQAAGIKTGTSYFDEEEYEYNYFIVTDLEGFMSDDSDEYYVSRYDNGRFVANKQYYLVMCIVPESNQYSLEDFESATVTFGGQNATQKVLVDAGYAYAIHQLPILTTEDSVQKITEFSVTISNYQIGKKIGDLTFEINTAIAETIAFGGEKEIESVVRMEIHDTESSASSIWGVGSEYTLKASHKYTFDFIIKAKDGVSFLNLTKDNVFVTAQKTIYDFHVSAGGGYLEFSVELRLLSDYHEHNFTDVEEDFALKTPATCENNAEYYKSCSCGELSTQTFVKENSKLDHSISSSWTKTESGHFHACINGCAHQEDFATHTPNIPDATQDEAQVCSVCGYVIAPMLSHTHSLTKHEKVDATCVTAGTKEYYSCSGCEQKFEDEQGLSPIANFETWVVTTGEHNFGEWTAEVPATCLAAGTKAHKTCSTCHKHFDQTNVEILNLSIAKLTHQFDTHVERTWPTCSTVGTKSHWHCSLCDKNYDYFEVELTDTTIPTNSNYHSFELVKAVAETCLTNGIMAHLKCSECNKLFNMSYAEISDPIIYATGHNFGDWEEIVPATCSAAGTLAHKTCSKCNKHFDADENEIESLTIQQLEHNFGEWIAEVSATCVATGTKAHKTCSLCHKHFDNEDVEIADLTLAIDENNHSLGEFEKDGTKHWKTCSLCNNIIGEENHESDTITNGQKRVCDDCGTEFGNIMITSLDFKLTGYETNAKITDITLSLNEGSVGVDISQFSYNEDRGWFIITDINRFYNDYYWQRDDFIYTIDDPTDTGRFLPNKDYYLYVRLEISDGFDYSQLTRNTFTVDGNAGSVNNFAKHSIKVFQNYFRLPRLSGENTTPKASSIELEMSGHEDNAVITNTAICETSTTKMLEKAPVIAIYKDGTAVTDNTTVYDTTSRFTFDIVLTAKNGYSFIGFTQQDVLISGIGNPESIKISASGGKLLAKFRMPSLMGEHTHTYGDFLHDDDKHWHECTLCYAILHKDAHVYDDNEDAICNTCDFARTFKFDKIEFELTGFEVDGLISGITLSATSLNNGAVWKHGGKYGKSFDYSIASFYSYSQNRTDVVDADQVAYFMPDIEYYLIVQIHTKNKNYSFENLNYSNISINNGRCYTYKTTQGTESDEFRIMFALNKLTTKSTIQKAPKQTFVLSGYEKDLQINNATLSLSNSECGTKIISATFMKNGAEVSSTSDECFVDTQGTKYQIKVVLDITGRYSFFGFGEDDFTLAEGSRFESVQISTSGSRMIFVITLKALIGEHKHSLGDWVKNQTSHWHECSQCYDVFDKASHVYDNASDYICNICGYERTLPLSSVEFVLSGYVYGNTASQLQIAPIESQSVCVAGGGFGTLLFLALDESILESTPSSLVSEGTYVLTDKIEYYLVVALSTQEPYVIGNLTKQNIKISGIGTVVDFIAYSDSFGEIIFKLPELFAPHTHTGTWENEVPATCSETGTKAHKTCLICHKHFDKDGNEITNLTLAIDESNHSLGEFEKDETKHWKTCTACGDIIGEENHHGGQATCSSKAKCEDCQNEYGTANASAHTFGEWVDEVPATCVAAGVKGHKTCVHCGKHFDLSGNEITDLTISIDENAHKFGEWIEEIPATTEREGTKGHKTCEHCHKHFDADGVEIEDLKTPRLQKGLSAGAIAAIAVSSVLVVNCGGFAIVWFVIKKKKFADLAKLMKIK